MTCFVAGIVKGIIEHNDPRRHFGSWLAFGSHMDDAVKCGFVGDDRKSITNKGIEYYEKKDLKSLPDCRSYFWQGIDWTF